jgi:hypothetical protein
MVIESLRNKLRSPVRKFDCSPNTSNEGAQRCYLNNKTFSEALYGSNNQDDNENQVNVIHNSKQLVEKLNWGKNREK